MNKTDSSVQDFSFWSNAISHKWYIAPLLDDIATGDIASVWETANSMSVNGNVSDFCQFFQHG